MLILAKKNVMNNTNSEINKSNLVMCNSLIDDNSDETVHTTESENSSDIDSNHKINIKLAHKNI
jgi:hypothetical protein